MGYLSQRKKQIRTNLTIQILLIVLAGLSVLGFMDNQAGNMIDSWRFQIYLMLFFILIYSLINKLYVYSLFSILLLILNFFVVSSAVNIFLRDKNDTSKIIQLAYQKQPQSIIDSFDKILKQEADIISIVNPKDNSEDFRVLLDGIYNIPKDASSADSFIISKYPIEVSGIIKLAVHNTAAFASVDIEDNMLTFITLDFSKISPKNLPAALNNLEAFIATRDEPVIIIGDFGAVAWAKPMSRFLDHTGFYIKNPITTMFKNYFLPPKFYVIGYKNLYFHNQQSLPSLSNPFSPVMLKIGI